jgi:hypothetical protein
VRPEKADLKKLIELHEQGRLVGVFETSIQDYHDAPGVSKSNISDVRQSPATYLHKKQNPSPSTDSKDFGNLMHAMVLEGDSFEEKYAVVDIGRRGTKDWDAAVAANPGKTVVKLGGEYGVAKARPMAEAARKHPRVKLLEGLTELSFFWKDPATGILCKCRPDKLTLKGTVVDYKTVGDRVYPARVWARTAYKYNYHVSAAFTLDGIHHALEQAGIPLDAFPLPKSYVFYAQEKEAPFLVKPWVINDASVTLGRRSYQDALALIKQCEVEGHWPGYPEEIEEFDCPEYAWKDEVDGE